MIHDIYPNFMDIEFKDREPDSQDKVIAIENQNILVVGDQSNKVDFPTIEQFNREVQQGEDDYIYLFAVNDEHYYLYVGDAYSTVGESYVQVHKRELFNGYDDVYGLIVFTAVHINEWYIENKFCGKCGKTMSQRKGERVLKCTSCDLTKYPQINPVVIVGIHDGNKLLLTKYANSTYDRYALVAGFVEVGESFEDAVRREVMEEVGLQVKNITYFASQPWGITGGILAGYFAELDGDNTVKLDLEELKEGTWFTKEDMPELYENEKSLTRTMMYDWWKR